ncbi:MAG: hypothetical protein ACRDRS_01865 [Pseudonocardiaceae bacterium]
MNSARPPLSITTARGQAQANIVDVEDKDFAGAGGGLPQQPPSQRDRPRRIRSSRTPAEVFEGFLASAIASTSWHRRAVPQKVVAILVPARLM